jgi:hypothetical protein
MSEIVTSTVCIELLLLHFTSITLGGPLNSGPVQPLFAPPILHINDPRRTGSSKVAHEHGSADRNEADIVII